MLDTTRRRLIQKTEHQGRRVIGGKAVLGAAVGGGADDDDSEVSLLSDSTTGEHKTLPVNGVSHLSTIPTGQRENKTNHKQNHIWRPIWLLDLWHIAGADVWPFSNTGGMKIIDFLASKKNVQMRLCSLKYCWKALEVNTVSIPVKAADLLKTLSHANTFNHKGKWLNTWLQLSISPTRTAVLFTIDLSVIIFSTSQLQIWSKNKNKSAKCSSNVKPKIFSLLSLTQQRNQTFKSNCTTQNDYQIVV